MKRFVVLAMLIGAFLIGLLTHGPFAQAAVRGLTPPVDLAKQYHCAQFFHGHHVRGYLNATSYPGFRGTVTIWTHSTDFTKTSIACSK